MNKWLRMKYHPSTTLGEDGKRITGCPEHIELSRKAATEGMVLLKNEGILPLPHGTKVAVFGKAQVDYVKSGGGSGDVFSAYERNIHNGLKIKESEGKISVFDKTHQYYSDTLTYDSYNLPGFMTEAFLGSKKGLPGFAVEPDLPENLVKEALEYTDTAIITISRFSTEGIDRTAQKGDFYLTDNEQKMIDIVSSNFKNVIAVLNIGGIIETNWIKDNPKIGAALLIWNSGMEGGLATADILCGDANPSGKLTDTFASSFDAYPSSDTFNDSNAYIKYYEDIYVGYRYFETIPDATKYVNYPFGFGLSYTTFDFSDTNLWSDEETIYIRTTVKNTGNYAGREVAQVYYSAPQGVLGKPSKELGTFIKTSLLEPGESETLSMSFPIEYMSSYDDMGKLQKSAYVLEKGDYTFHIGTSVRHTKQTDFIYNVSEDFRVVKQLSEQLPPYLLEKRLLSDGTYEELPRSNPRIPEYLSDIQEKFPEKHKSIPVPPITFDQVAEGKVTLDEFVDQLDLKYIMDLLGGKPCRGVANTSGIGSRENVVPTGTDAYGVPCAMTCDGPAGVRINKLCEAPTTAFPCASLLACTWDTEILTEVGRIGALEAKENNFGIWLAPGMNIHRTPLCGRNFEYFSEDPLIAGKMAAAFVSGAQSQGISATPKHFACNNREDQRRYSDSVVSERALREIYLKGFEICIKESDPWLIMSSYNMINGTHASENYDLLTNILRKEWDYNGAVTTDWFTNGNQRLEVFAGNDIKMPYSDNIDALLDRIERNSEHKYLYASAKRVLELLLKLD